MLKQADLGGFTGSESMMNVTTLGMTRQPKPFYATDGVQFVMKHGGASGAFWLITAILSHQPTVLKNELAREMQFWTLKVTEKKHATLTCEDGNGGTIVTQKIEYTDFDLPELKIWIELGSIDGVNESYVMMLPSER